MQYFDHKPPDDQTPIGGTCYRKLKTLPPATAQGYDCGMCSQRSLDAELCCRPPLLLMQARFPLLQAEFALLGSVESASNDCGPHSTLVQSPTNINLLSSDALIPQRFRAV